MKNPYDPRHNARILALELLFVDTYSFYENTKSEELVIEDYLEENEIEQYSEDLLEQILSGVKKHQPEIDKLITEFAPQWPIKQIKKVDLQILRISIFEGFIGKITPPKVAIDEGIELAKEFGGNASDKFVNGVLGAVYEQMSDQFPEEEDSDSKPKSDPATPPQIDISDTAQVA